MDHVTINIFVLLWYLMTCNNYIMALDNLKDVYKSDNIRIKFFCKNIWILRNQESIKKCMSVRSKPELTYLSKTFFDSHYHKMGIGNIDISHDYWSMIHSSLLNAMMNIMQSDGVNTVIDDLIENHSHFLINNNKPINVNLRKFISCIWAEFCFGKQKHLSYNYSIMREKYTECIGNTFYDNKWKNYPIIGPLTCKWKRFKYKGKFEEADEILKSLLACSKTGFFKLFHQELIEYINACSEFNDTILQQVMMDNAFLCFLVEDFLYGIILESVITKAKGKSLNNFSNNNNNNNNNNDTTLFIQSLRKGFLFPWRARKITRNNNIFKKGDYAICNVLDTGLYFSCGPRSCIGQTFVRKFFDRFWNTFSQYDMNESTDLELSQIIRHKDPNIGMIVSKHWIDFKFKRDYLKKHIPYSIHKGVSKFYHVHEITENPKLYGDIVEKLVSHIEIPVEHAKNIGDDIVIVSMEARGWLFASPVAYKCKIPLTLARKSNKLPGVVSFINYKKDGYDKSESIEIAQNMKSKKAIIIDDGIASGKTLSALCKLLESQKYTIVLICCVINHTYTKRKFNKYKVKTLFDI